MLDALGHRNGVRGADSSLEFSYSVRRRLTWIKKERPKALFIPKSPSVSLYCSNPFLKITSEISIAIVRLSLRDCASVMATGRLYEPSVASLGMNAVKV